jgi:hypothetical protein
MAWGIEAVPEPVAVRLVAPVPLGVPKGERRKSLWLGWLESNNFLGLPFILPHCLILRSWMAGSSAPVMYWAFRTTLYSDICGLFTYILNKKIDATCNNFNGSTELQFI